MMARRRNILFCVMLAGLVGVCSVSEAGGKAPETPLTEQGEKLQAQYADMLSSLNKEVAAALPGGLTPGRRYRPV